MEIKTIVMQRPTLLSILAAGCLVASFIFILSLPKIGFGAFRQSDLSASVLFAVNALMAAVLAIIAAGRHGPLLRSISLHPFVLIPFAIGAFSVLIMPFQDLPIRHLLGAPQTAEGTALWLSWSIMTAAGILLWKTKIWKHALVGMSVVSLLLLFGGILLNEFTGFIYTAFHFADFTAASFFALLPLCWPYFYRLQRSLPSARAKQLAWLGAYIVFNCFVFFTKNKVAILYAVAGIPALLALLYLLSRMTKAPSAHAKILSLLLVLIPLSALGFYLLMGIFFRTQGFYPLEEIEIFNTMASRSFLISAGLQDSFSTLKAFLIGTGWGTFTEHLTRHMPLEWVNLNLFFGEQWDGITTDHFHSHNLFAESFMAIGLPGLLLTLLLFAGIPLFATKKAFTPAIIFSGGLLAVSSFWFFLMPNIPLVAFAFAACAKIRPVKGFAFINKFVTIAAFIAMAVLLLFSSAAVLQAGISSRIEATPQLGAAVKDVCPTAFDDFGAGGLHLAQTLTGPLRAVGFIRLENPNAYTREDITTMIGTTNQVFCQTAAYAERYDGRISHRLLVARLIVRGEMLIGFTDYLDPQTVALYANGWKEELETWLDKVPTRPDMAVTFLSWSLAQGHEDNVLSIAQKLRAHNPEDPVGLWFEGIVLTGQPERAQEGIELMRRALKNGAERMMTIDPALKAQLLGP